MRDASDTIALDISMDVQQSSDWAEGVIVSGSRTHLYLNVSVM